VHIFDCAASNSTSPVTGFTTTGVVEEFDTAVENYQMAGGSIQLASTDNITASFDGDGNARGKISSFR